MAVGRFGFGSTNDDQPIGFWMDDQNDEAAQRDAYHYAGRERWMASTRSGENLGAKQPIDVIALGTGSSSPTLTMTDGAAGEDGSVDSSAAGFGEQPDTQSIAPSALSVRYVKAQPGDNITRLVGSSDSGAVGAFARLNGMDGRNSTIYAGKVYAIPASSGDPSADDVALGAQLLDRDNARLAAWRNQHAANDPFHARFDAGLNVWTGAPVAVGPASVRSRGQRTPPAASGTSWYDNPIVKIPAGAAAFAGGLAFGGLVRGPIRTGQFIGDTLDFGARLLDPHDAEYHPANSAQDQLNEFGHGAVDLGRWAASDPGGAMKLAAHEFYKWRNAHDPTSIPIAATTSDEVHDQFDVGANDGEYLTPLAAIKRVREAVEAAQGGKEAIQAAHYAAKVKPVEHWRLITRGDSPLMADYLSDPYPEDAMGSHYVARSAKFPEQFLGVPLPQSIAGQPLPRWYVDSRLNVNKFEGLSRDQAYTGHYGYGAGFYGARLPADVNGGKGWSGRRLNVPRYGPAERLVKGAPPALKKATVGGAAVGGLTAYNLFGGDRPE